ncbi:hypothetical protein HAX54_004634 [Datura stramonium]|uniref:Fatty acyl-CoA reductase n=1 Tax=Datura stramonium TaxID=4076 RepID=A0ABS8T7A5_DATST|nr:hypothetical protein [Datura stramonium]
MKSENVGHHQQYSQLKANNGIGIVEFFEGKNILVTGATGFLAKVLIEKMLRTTPKVNKIYLLIRAKDKEAAIHRLENEIIESELFKCLEEMHGESYKLFIENKLVPVVGNIHEPNLDFENYIWEVLLKQHEVQDIRMRLIKRKVEYLKNFNKLYEPYLFYKGRFHNGNTQKLMGEMSEEEKRSFEIDVTKINWRNYFVKTHIPGVQKYVLKEKRIH